MKRVGPPREEPRRPARARSVGPEPGAVRGRHDAPRARSSWSPAPARARPACSRTGSPTWSASSACRRSRSSRSRSPTRPRARCASGSPSSSGPSPAACGCRPSTPRAPGSCAARPALLGYRSSFTIYDQADAVRLTDWIRRDQNLDPKRFPARQLHAQISALKNELVLPRRVRGDGGRSGRAPPLRDLHGVPAPAAGSVGRRLRRSARARGAAVPRAPRSARALPPVASGTCSSTSSRTRTPRSGSSCACSPPSTAA